MSLNVQKKKFQNFKITSQEEVETAAEREGRLRKGENSIFCKIFCHMRPQAIYICDQDFPTPKPEGMQNQLHWADDTETVRGDSGSSLQWVPT